MATTPAPPIDTQPTYTQPTGEAENPFDHLSWEEIFAIFDSRPNNLRAFYESYGGPTAFIRKLRDDELDF